MTAIHYCRKCGSSITAAWDGEKAFREQIDPDCRVKLTPEEIDRYIVQKRRDR